MNISDLLRFIESRNLFSRTDNILLAVSGGIDSVVMAYMFHKAGFHFAVAHCNFGLRGVESQEDDAFVRILAHKMHVPFFSEKFDTENVAARRKISIQMAARDLRYDWFEKIRQNNGFLYVATAHHLDDQVETFLINLIRGTGISGLHGIPVKHQTIIRPMMFTCRQDIEQYAKFNKISYRTDQSNNETKYLRNKIRHQLIPLLGSINPEFSRGLTETVRKLSEFEQIGNKTLEDWCCHALKTSGTDQTVDIKLLLNTCPVEPFAWALFSPFGFNETQVMNILGCLDKESGKVFNSASHRLVKDRQRIVISKLEGKIAERIVKISLFKNFKTIKSPLQLTFKRIGSIQPYEIPASDSIASLDFDKLQFPLTIRRWQPGDAFYPLGMKRKKKKLSDFFIDQKFSLKEKEQTCLLCSGHDIVWIIGHRIDHRYRVTSATAEILRIVMTDFILTS